MLLSDFIAEDQRARTCCKPEQPVLHCGLMDVGASWGLIAHTHPALAAEPNSLQCCCVSPQHQQVLPSLHEASPSYLDADPVPGECYLVPGEELSQGVDSAAHMERVRPRQRPARRVLESDGHSHQL